ncbi:FBP domain-containing protein [Streptomyces verrucosisporus]|uniref:FBP domain-containing protein n=1 Tax=Streptomyces verrucosisporus TaxID=1695161 RepID=UPI0019D29CB0|nr:FBP domain-containing protein [Streptomyces verrucosisporus]MBN3929153.1 FBP domain-containing protein [Streptomyces verrucosisporus]
MRPVTEKDIRASFVNCSKGEAGRMALPRDLTEQPWDDLDFPGRRDPAAPDRRRVVAERGGPLTGVALRSPARRPGRARPGGGVCSLCLTTHPADGVALMAAPKAGRAGREGDSVGLSMCADPACSLYVRGGKVPDGGGRLEESPAVEEQAERAGAGLPAFLDRLHA